MRMLALPATLAASVVAIAAGYASLRVADDLVANAPRALAAASEQAAPTTLDTSSAAPSAPTPTTADGWQSLARSHAAQGRHDAAVAAYRQAARLRPDDATLLTEYAFSAAVTPRRAPGDEPQRLVERALQVDPRSQKALALAGTLALDRHDFEAATQHWERLAQLEPRDSPSEREVQASIAQARRLAVSLGSAFDGVKAR